MEIGHDQFVEAVGGRDDSLVNRLVRDTGIYALTYFIERVLDEHYPADIFGAGDTLIPTWVSDRGGEDIDPGIKWVALLRHAIKEVSR